MKFEDNLAKLEDTVKKMESGELSLDDMISSFEEGRKEKVTKDGSIEEMKL